ncbi:MAG: AAA family ATPase [Oscillospiraceae bacterium]|nr:AAA family ATPase [Oscillospiraceae bacterium]
MGKAIVIASGKGGTGKTSATAAIGTGLALLAQRVLCIDCDAGLKNLDLALGLAGCSALDFADVLEGRAAAEDAVISHPDISRLDFLQAPSNTSPSDIDVRLLTELTDRFKLQYDYILLDAPAGLGPGFRYGAACADMAIVIVTADASSLRDGQRTVMELNRLGIDRQRLIVNRVKPRLLKKTQATIDDMIDAVGAQLIGLVQEDENVTLAANSEVPLLLYSTQGAAAQFMRIARRINGEHIPLGDI